MKKMTLITTIAMGVIAGAVQLGPSRAHAVATCPPATGHRGAQTEAPENTVPSVQAALARTEEAEVDIQFSKAGSSGSFPILMHDATVDRTTNGTGTPGSMYLTAILQLWAADYAPWNVDPRYTNTKVPYIYDVLVAAKNANGRLLLDMHADPDKAQADKLVYYLDTTGMRDRVTVMASPTIIQHFRDYGYGDLNFRWLEYSPAGLIRRGSAITAVTNRYAVPLRDVDSPALISYWHSYGINVYVWTTDDDTQDNVTTWARLASYGVDGIVTGRLPEYQAWLATCTVPTAKVPQR